MLLIGFDRDDCSNKHVARAFARLIAARLLDAAKRNYRSCIKILSWNAAVKGLDDALVQNIPIQERSALEWFDSLNPLCRDEVKSVAAASAINFLDAGG